MSAPDGAGMGPRILIVDDEAVNIAILRRMLQRCGHGCTVARSGPEAIVSAEAEPCDLVLMDISMPGMDGITAAGEIGRRLGAARPPVVAVTANTTDAQREACAAAGFAGFVPKPVKLDELRSIIVRLAPLP